MLIPNTLGVMRDPARALGRLRQRYGDPFSVRTVNGLMAVSAEPEQIRAIFTAPPETFRVFGAQSLRPLLGSLSVLTTDGAPHAANRKLLIPPLHGPALRAMADAMGARAEEEFHGIRAGNVVNAAETGQRLTLDIILEVVFGVTELQRRRRLSQALMALMHELNPLAIFIPALQQRWLPPFARFLARREEFDQLLRDAVDHAAAEEGGAPSVARMLLQTRAEDGTPLTWQELRDHLITLLTAGHETTAVAFSWALYWIHRQPEVEERLRAELDAAGDAASKPWEMPYLAALCQETLRIHPVVGAVFRRLAVPFTFGGYELPENAVVGAAIVLAHQREKVFPEPHRFRPERFLERTFTPFEFLPFGGGNRRCLGAAFALMELPILLAAFLRRGRYRLRDQTFPGVVRRNVTLAPARAVELEAV